MEITKEQIKRLVKAVKAMQEDTIIDDDVSGGYQPAPFKDAYAVIYQVIDECERGENVDAGENTLPIQHVINCPRCGGESIEKRGYGMDWYCKPCQHHFNEGCL